MKNLFNVFLVLGLMLAPLQAVSLPPEVQEVLDRENNRQAIIDELTDLGYTPAQIRQIMQQSEQVKEQNSQAQIHRDNAAVSQDAADSNKTTAVIHGIAMGVCLLACVKEKIPFFQYMKAACMGASVTASITDIAMNSNLGSIIANTASLALVGAHALGMGGLAASVGGDKITGEKGSCFSAGAHTLLMGLKLYDKSEAEKKRDEALDLAEQYDSLVSTPGGQTPIVPTTPGTEVTRTSGGSNESNSNSVRLGSVTEGGSGPGNGAGGLGSSSSNCGTYQKSGQASAFFACAKAKFGDQVPDAFLEDDFLSKFNQATGQSLGNVLASIPNSASAGQIGAAILGPKFDSERIANDLDNMNQALLSDPNTMAALRQATGSTAIAGESLGGSQAKKFGKFNPFGKKAKDKQVENVLFGKRSPASKGPFDRSAREIVNDRSLSLFDRISHRYKKSRMKRSRGFSSLNDIN